MLYPVESAEEWAARYGLPFLSRPCANGCGLMQKADIPFATETFRGLKSAPHPCGDNYTLRVQVYADKKERADMKLFAAELSSYLAGGDE